MGEAMLAGLTLKVGEAPTGAGTRIGFIALIGCLLAFVFIRISTRLMRSDRVPWWPGSIKTGGLHIHHLVFGIVMILLAGFVGLAFNLNSPWIEIVALTFGIGAGLTLDEYALWLHLEDVYWSEEGRRSVDAVIMALLIGALIAAGVVPFSNNDGDSIVALGLTILIDVACCVIALFKGKYWMGIVGLFIPGVAQIGAIRLATPDSPWARRRYPAGGRKIEKAAARARRHNRRWRRFQDLIGGTPTAPLRSRFPKNEPDARTDRSADQRRGLRPGPGAGSGGAAGGGAPHLAAGGRGRGQRPRRP